MSNHRMSTPEASKALGIPVHVITYWLGQIPYPAEQDDQGQWRLTPEAMAVLETVRDLKGENRSMETIRRHVRELQDVPPPPLPAAKLPTPARTQVAVEAKSEPPRPAAPRAPRPADGMPQNAQRPAEGPPRPPAQAPRKGGPPQAQAQAPRPGQPAPAGPPAQAAPPAVSGPPARQPGPPPAQVAQSPVPVMGTHDLASHVARAVSEAVRQETMLAQRYAHAAHQIGKLEAENEHLRTMLNAAQTKHTREADDARCRIAELEAKPAPKPKTPWWAWLTIGVML